jgi:hypothetical protein
MVSGTKYYVKNGGNDLNSGLDDNNAWGHHPWMSSWTGNTILAPGDIVYMKRGDTWTLTNVATHYMRVRQSGTAGSPITTTWYGASGNKPVIQITDDYRFSVIEGYGKSYITFDHLDIRHFSSTQDLSHYQNGIKFGKDENNNVPHDWIITNCDIHNIPRSGIYGNDDSYNITIGNTSASSYATDLLFSNHIYDCGYAGIILCGRDPNTNNSNWRIFYNYIHDIDIGGGLRDSYGITFSTETVGSGQGYSTGWPNYCVAKYNRITDIPGHSGIDCHGGTNIFVQENYVYNCLHGIITQAADRAYAETAVLENAYIEKNIIENSGNSPLSNYVFIFVVAENVLHRATNCYIKDNVIFYTTRPSNETDAYGICVYNVDGLTIEGNTIYNGPIGTTGAGIGISSNSNMKLRNIIVRNNWINNWDRSIYITTKSVDGDLKFYDNIINSSGRPFVGAGGTIFNNITIYNNTFLSANTAIQPYIIDFVASGAVTLANGASLIIKNNIFGFNSPSSTGRYVLAPENINGTFTCDYNLYWNSIFDTPFKLQNTYYKFSDWKTIGFDMHSLYNTDPLFKNNSGSYLKYSDFVLKSSSPAINAGIDVGLMTDFVGTPIFGLPDIGAFEMPPVEIITNSPVEGYFYKENNLNLEYILRSTNLDLSNSYFALNSGQNQYFIDSTGTIPLNSDEGINKLVIHAKDSAGNSSSKTINYTIDTIPVDIIILSPNVDSNYRENIVIFDYILRDKNLDLINSFYRLNGLQDYFSDSTGTIPLISKEGLNNLEILVKDLAGNTSSKTIEYTYSPYTGIGKINQEIQFHPNPVNENVKLVYPEGKVTFIKIYNVSGVALIEIQDTDKNGETDVDLSNCAPGLYLFKLSDNDGTTLFGKVVKE